MSLKQFCWTEVHSVNSTMLVMHKNEVVHKTLTLQVLIKPQSPQHPQPRLRVEPFPLFTRCNLKNTINIKLYSINQSTLCFGAIWEDNQQELEIDAEYFYITTAHAAQKLFFCSRVIRQSTSFLWVCVKETEQITVKLNLHNVLLPLS